MQEKLTTQDKMRRFILIGSTTIMAGLLAACGGGGMASESDGAGETGFEYGASQEEVDAAIADLEPMTLNFQHIAGSEEAVTAKPALDFKEEVEERSNGKITVDITYNMAIAGNDEVVDALNDGRIDLSFFSTSYYPQEFPEVSALEAPLGTMNYSPVVGELVAYAVGSELAWNNEEILSSYEDAGLVPLVPLTPAGAYSLSCGSPLSGNGSIDGKQIRIGASAQGEAISELGGVPVSVSFDEIYEAVQRGTVDCDLSAMATKELSGVYDAAPHLAYTTTTTFPRFPSSYVAGTNFKEMPLAYQQIIADSSALLHAGDIQTYINSNAKHINDLHSVDGSITELDEGVQSELADILVKITEGAIDDGTLDADILDHIADLENEWQAKVEDLGYEDGGEMSSANEWVDVEADLSDYAWAVHEETGAVDHRPGNNS